MGTIDINTFATVLGIVVNMGGLGYIAVKVEHRLTKMETHIDHLLKMKKAHENG